MPAVREQGFSLPAAGGLPQPRGAGTLTGMKTPALVATCSVVSLAVGAAVGWRQGGSQVEKAWRTRVESGQFVERSAAPPAPPTLAGGSPGKDAASAGRTAAAGESAAAKAQRLFDEIRLSDGGLAGGPPTEIFDFLQALSGCDAATLEGMIATLTADNQPGGRRSGRELLSMVLARYANLKPEEAVRLATADGKRARDRDVEMTMAMAFAHLGDDPARAQRLIDSVPEGDARNSAETAWLIARAKRQPDTVLEELLAKESPGRTEQRLIEGIISRKAAESPEETVAYVGRLKPEVRSQVLGRAVQTWLDRDPQAAGTWAKQSTDPEAWLAVARHQSSDDTRATPAAFAPADMRAQLSQLTGTDGGAFSQLTGVLAADLAASSPTDALAWSATLTGNARTSAEIGAGNAWIQRDPVAASEWLSTLPPGNTHDQLAHTLASRIATDDPEAAIRWAAAIQSPDLRHQAEEQILRSAPGSHSAVQQLRQSKSGKAPSQ